MANTYNTAAKETQPKRSCYLNGTQQDLLDRFAVSEICQHGSPTEMPHNGRTTATPGPRKVLTYGQVDLLSP
jgi:hypothetical protein